MSALCVMVRSGYRTENTAAEDHRLLKGPHRAPRARLKCWLHDVKACVDCVTCVENCAKILLGESVDSPSPSCVDQSGI